MGLGRALYLRDQQLGSAGLSHLDDDNHRTVAWMGAGAANTSGHAPKCRHGSAVDPSGTGYLLLLVEETQQR